MSQSIAKAADKEFLNILKMYCSLLDRDGKWQL